MKIKTATLEVGAYGSGAKQFSDRLSAYVIDGWEILSSGNRDGQGGYGIWWAIVQKVEED